jgi:hypothetical protein
LIPEPLPPPTPTIIGRSGWFNARVPTLSKSIGLRYKSKLEDIVVEINTRNCAMFIQMVGGKMCRQRTFFRGMESVLKLATRVGGLAVVSGLFSELCLYDGIQSDSSNCLF